MQLCELSIVCLFAAGKQLQWRASASSLLYQRRALALSMQVLVQLFERRTGVECKSISQSRKQQAELGPSFTMFNSLFQIMPMARKQILTLLILWIDVSEITSPQSLTYQQCVI